MKTRKEAKHETKKVKKQKVKIKRYFKCINSNFKRDKLLLKNKDVSPCF